MSNKQQTRLEEEGISKRKELNLKNDFQREADKNYSEQHDSAFTHDDKNHPHGKGSKNKLSQTFLTPNRKASKDGYSELINTEEGGGSYDIYGTNSSSGREYLKRISLYNKDNQYGRASIDDSANIEDGQYFV